jgi:spore coat polysaccharide biosynthesis predicted glycosyltransferase SpsG
MLISIIACPNGMGHFYRLLDIAKALSKKNKIYFLCSKKQKGKLDNKFDNINFIPIMEDIKY